MLKGKILKRVHYYVKGRVQGVGFRYFTKSQADDIGLSGWVRNLPDGQVEAEAQGSEEQLSQFYEALGRGPSFGRVDDIRKNEMTPVDTEKSFEITH